MIAWAWLGIAAAADRDDLEEIIVYGDDFARWDHTRWLIQSEQWIPLGILFAGDENYGFLSHAYQVRAVIACEKDAKLSKNKWEVSCEIEDVSLAVTTDRFWKRERDRAAVQEVLDQIDHKLTGMDVQLQVNELGGVTNFDLEGVSSDNSRERGIDESLRQIVSRMMAGFSLRIPEHAQVKGQWIEYNSKLMDMPSVTASRGSTTMVHQVTPFKNDLQIVQTVGEGTVAVNLPFSSRDMFATSNLLDDTAASQKGSGGNLGGELGGGGGSTSTQSVASATLPKVGAMADGEADLALTYKLNATGVAVFRKADGIMSERVWMVDGTATASSGGGVNTPPFRNAGRIQILGADDRPNVGATGQVAWPGAAVEGLQPWTSVETMPSGGPG